ncbi:MAG TPA: hypothetical protein VFT74_18730 [Isosphaeraceae bacterium]|nr:hypothetical protein [Isosphaeraceae bacterium]
MDLSLYNAHLNEETGAVTLVFRNTPTDPNGYVQTRRVSVVLTESVTVEDLTSSAPQQ